MKAFAIIALLALAPPGTGCSAAAPAEPAVAVSQSAAERDECTANLKAIYQAIQAYQRDHKDLPNWLSDLVPDYLKDPNLLVCPVSRHTGKIESAPLADPKIATSYLFEFCPVPLGNSAPNASTRTRREWKRRQMGLVGSIVPVVRCRHHDPVLNLSFDGRIYDSPSFWEAVVSNQVPMAELTPARLFANEPARGSSTETPSKSEPPQFPARDPKARKELLDLSDFFNAKLTDSWHGNSGNDLAELPSGLQTFAGVEFDVRGIVQLSSQSPSASKFPAAIKGIKVHQTCQRLNFLHAAGFGAVRDEGKQIGSFVVHYTTQQMRLEIPIVYGTDVRNWHWLAQEPAAAKELRVAWTGSNAVSKKSKGSIRLFITTWTNVAPSIEIETIDYVSSMANPAPFLLAITAE